MPLEEYRRKRDFEATPDFETLSGIARRAQDAGADIVKIAAMVQEQLTQEGYEVDLLREFDARLNGYRALAIVSIHNDSCEYINDEATGYKVAAALNTNDINRANRLTACLVDRYQKITGLDFHAGSITAESAGRELLRLLIPGEFGGVLFCFFPAPSL
mgnify:CR=1 FL=1